MPSLISICAVIPSSLVLAERADGKIYTGRRNIGARARHLMQRGARGARQEEDAATSLMSFVRSPEWRYSTGNPPQCSIDTPSLHPPTSPIDLRCSFV